MAADHLTHLVLVYPLVILCVYVCVCVCVGGGGGGETCSYKLFLHYHDSKTVRGSLQATPFPKKGRVSHTATML